MEVHIIKEKNGLFRAFTIDEGIVMEGETADECRRWFVEQQKMDGGECLFFYDIASFLSVYQSKFTLAGLSRITGVAQGQLSHYATGRRKPSLQTIRKIESAIREFGSELSEINFLPEE